MSVKSFKLGEPPAAAAAQQNDPCRLPQRIHNCKTCINLCGRSCELKSIRKCPGQPLCCCQRRSGSRSTRIFCSLSTRSLALQDQPIDLDFLDPPLLVSTRWSARGHAKCLLVYDVRLRATNGHLHWALKTLLASEQWKSITMIETWAIDKELRSEDWVLGT